jgi:hypothetical protein
MAHFFVAFLSILQLNNTMDIEILRAIERVLEASKDIFLIEVALDDGTIFETVAIKIVTASKPAISIEPTISFVRKGRDADLVYVPICHIHHVAIKSSKAKTLGFAIEKDIALKESTPPK